MKRLHPILQVFLIGAHVILCRKHGQFRKGTLNPPPSWLFPAINVSVLVIIVMIVTRPF